MARKSAFLLGMIVLVSVTAQAQDKVEFFGGYSYERFNGARNLNGWEISGQYKFAGFLGAVADLDAHYGSQVRSVNFMVGPQVSVPFRISPFAHVLVGIGHLGGGGPSDTSFSTALGGGVDLKLVPTISWRVIQVDDVVTRFFGGTQQNARVSTGIIFRF